MEPEGDDTRIHARRERQQGLCVGWGVSVLECVLSVLVCVRVCADTILHVYLSSETALCVRCRETVNRSLRANLITCMC